MLTLIGKVTFMMRTVMVCVLFGAVACTCDNTILKSVPSPDGRLTAVLFERGCGATTGPNLQMSVAARGELPEEGGNILVLDAGHDTTLAQGSLMSFVRVVWTGPMDLLVTYSPKLRTFKRESQALGVKITYQALSAHYE